VKDQKETDWLNRNEHEVVRKNEHRTESMENVETPVKMPVKGQKGQAKARTISLNDSIPDVV